MAIRAFGSVRVFLALTLALIASQAWSAGSVPDCLSNKQKAPLPVMNDLVLKWKKSTAPQFKERALVEGVVTQHVLSRPTHEHFMISIGPQKTDILEVVYNVEFGALPKIQDGMHVMACGDYITVTNSAAKAIIHWVHVNPGDRDGGKHESGFLMIDQVQYGNHPSGK